MHVSLDEAKKYLRVDSVDDDVLLEGLIATAVILVKEVSRLDNKVLETYSDIVHTAELYAIAYLYEHREEADHKGLTETMKYLLFPIRKEAF